MTFTFCIHIFQAQIHPFFPACSSVWACSAGPVREKCTVGLHDWHVESQCISSGGYTLHMMGHTCVNISAIVDGLTVVGWKFLTYLPTTGNVRPSKTSQKKMNCGGPRTVLTNHVDCSFIVAEDCDRFLRSLAAQNKQAMTIGYISNKVVDLLPVGKLILQDASFWDTLILGSCLHNNRKCAEI